MPASEHNRYHPDKNPDNKEKAEEDFKAQQFHMISVGLLCYL